MVIHDITNFKNSNSTLLWVVKSLSETYSATLDRIQCCMLMSCPSQGTEEEKWGPSSWDICFSDLPCFSISLCLLSVSSVACALAISPTAVCWLLSFTSSSFLHPPFNYNYTFLTFSCCLSKSFESLKIFFKWWIPQSKEGVDIQY